MFRLREVGQDQQADSGQYPYLRGSHYGPTRKMNDDRPRDWCEASLAALIALVNIAVVFALFWLTGGD